MAQIWLSYGLLSWKVAGIYNFAVCELLFHSCLNFCFFYVGWFAHYACLFVLYAVLIGTFTVGDGVISNCIGV